MRFWGGLYYTVMLRIGTPLNSKHNIFINCSGPYMKPKSPDPVWLGLGAKSPKALCAYIVCVYIYICICIYTLPYTP